MQEEHNFDELADIYPLLEEMLTKISNGTYPNWTPILPALFNLHGKPLSLENHFPFEEMYNLHQPGITTFLTGRQVAKTTNVAAQTVLLSVVTPYLSTIALAPLYEQIRRLSSLYIAPFISSSPMKNLWTDPNTVKSVLQRTFKNHSQILCTFASTDADRCKGLSGSRLIMDEFQDMDPTLLPIIREVISHALYGPYEVHIGTPLTTDNILSQSYDRSSQAEWFVPCFRCTTNGKPTWNIPAIEHHLDRMIGPWHENISEVYPGTICHKCRQPISPRHGRWVHRYPDRIHEHSGYHIPQIILPHHYAVPKHWAKLLGKREGLGPTPTHKYYTEVLGIPYDQSANLVNDKELQRVSNLGENSDVIALRNSGKYRILVLAADWGGGGEDQISLTTLALLGLKPNGHIDIIWGKRLLTPHDHLAEAKEVRYYWNLFKPHYLAHDYNGAGTIRETLLVQSGVPVSKIMPCVYIGSSRSAPCRHIPATDSHPRDHYHIDKSRTLLLTCSMIRLQHIHFFNYDYKSQEDEGLIRDFLSLKEEKTRTAAAGEIYRISKRAGKIDDFAQAVNYGCVCIWHLTQNWPNIAAAAKYDITEAQADVLNPPELEE